MSSCQVVKLSRCQDVKLSSCQVVKLFCSNVWFQVVKMSSCQDVKLSSCCVLMYVFKLSSCQDVRLSSCQDVKMSSCQDVKLSSSHNWRLEKINRLSWHAYIFRCNPFFAVVFLSYGSQTLDILSHAFLPGCFLSHSALARPGVCGFLVHASSAAGLWPGNLIRTTLRYEAATQFLSL